MIMEVEDYSDEKIVKEMLLRIGENPKREGLKDTPKRVVKMWKEIFRGYDKNQLPKVTTFMNGTDGLVTDQMICDTGSFYSHCEHHIVPFFGKYYFAYIPHLKGKILGLSKVARVVDHFSAKLQVQERLVSEIVDYLWASIIHEGQGRAGHPLDIAPIGMALVIDGEHLCKTMRGVKKQGKMRTSKLVGAFKEDASTKAEFNNWVNQNGYN